MCRHNNWLHLAYKKAMDNPIDNYKHCAILVRSGRVMSIGMNHSKRGAIFDEVYGMKGFHAEADALSRFDPDETKGSILYVAGVSPKGSEINSCPCPLCQQVIEKYHLKGVYYLDRGEVKKL